MFKKLSLLTIALFLLLSTPAFAIDQYFFGIASDPSAKEFYYSDIYARDFRSYMGSKQLIEDSDDWMRAATRDPSMCNGGIIRGKTHAKANAYIQDQIERHEAKGYTTYYIMWTP